jgi:hypothetical protein
VTYTGSNFSSIRESNGESAGTGTFTYTKTGDNTGRVVMNYDATAGDFDDFNLTFTSATAGSLTGNSHSGADNAVTGNFTVTQ